jgi:hypothetical protein
MKEAETQRISMFIAISIPMTDNLAKIIAEKFKTVHNKDVLDCLSSMANICCSMASNDKCGEDASVDYVLRVMTGAIILYDHVDPAGVFIKTSPVNITKSIKALKKRPGTKGLINGTESTTHRYCTIHCTPLRRRPL